MKNKSRILFLVCGICAVVSAAVLVCLSGQTAKMKEREALYEEEQKATMPSMIWRLESLQSITMWKCFRRCSGSPVRQEP